MKRILNRILNRICIVWAVTLVLIMSQAQAATITVINKNDSGTGSLRQAIASAGAGDTVTFQPSLTGTIVLTSGELLINKTLTISGPGSARLMISGNSASRVFKVSNGTKVGPEVTLSGLAINEGFVAGNQVNSRGGGGILNDYGNVALYGCAFNRNVSEGFGGAVSSYGADGIARLYIKDCLFNANRGTGGGALSNVGDQYGKAYLEIYNSSLTGNDAYQGAAILSSGSFEGSSDLTVHGCNISNNTGEVGLGIFSYGEDSGHTSATVSNTVFSSNQNESVSGGGGAIYSGGSYEYGGTLNVSQCSFISNAGFTYGGAIASINTITTVRSSLFRSNRTTQNSGAQGNAVEGGGAIMHTSFAGVYALLVINSTFYQNRSNSKGGAILNTDSSATIRNNTFSDNSAAYFGHSVHCLSPYGSASVTVGGNIFQSSSPGANISKGGNGTIFSDGYNLSADAAGGNTSTVPGGLLNQTGDIRNTNPLLDPNGVQDNGGPTLTIALQSTSPALDKGSSFGVGGDQRAFNRPYDSASIPNAVGGDGSDIGAFENQPVPTVSVGDASIVEGNSGTKDLRFLVTFSTRTSPNTGFYFTKTDKTATGSETSTGGSDYERFNDGYYLVGEGYTSVVIYVPIFGDTIKEDDETFEVTILQAHNLLIGDGKAIGTIINDDNALPSLSINDTSISEGNGGGNGNPAPLSFTVSLSAAAAAPVTVQYTTANGTATAGSDYTATTGTLTIPAGQTSGTISVPVLGDTIAESNDTVLLNLSSSANALLKDNQGIGTILNDDAGPGLSINDVTITEGNSSTVNASFTVTLSAPSNQTVTANAITSNGNARSPADYTAAGVRLTFAPGETKKTVSVPVKGDLLDETNEAFFVILSSSVNAALARGRGIGTINDDDAPPTISIDDLSIGEGNSGQRAASLRLRLSAPSGQAVRVSYATTNSTTANSTAIAGNDYVAVAPTVVAFNAGSTVAYARVLINGDVLNEPNERFLVNLSSPLNATIADSQAVCTILNDDTAPALSINDVSITEGNIGTKNLTFTVTLSKASAQSISVNYATANGGATAGTTAGSDYLAKNGALTFAPGSALTRTISVVVNGDTLVEGNETLFIFLSGQTNASIAKARGVGTVTNDDVSG